MATMCDPPFARASASGPPVEPFRNLPVAASQSFAAPGTFMPTAVPAENACMAREAGPNQPR